MVEARLNASAVKPSSLPIAELLKNRSPFRVPRYQRPYDWDTERVGQFIEDLENIFEFRMTAADQRDHFFGSMVAIRYSDHSQAHTQIHEVVDGQQRLSTFCLLLAQITHAVTRLEKSARSENDTRTAGQLQVFGEEIKNKYLFYERYDIDNGTKSSEPRLTLSKTDNSKFRSLLTGDPIESSRDSHRKLQGAYDLLSNALIKPIVDSQQDLGEKLLRLRALSDSLLQGAFVIHVVAEDRSGGYRLFSVLNDRGKRLAIADLLRSRTLELLDSYPDLQNRAAERWDDVFIDGSKLADDFLQTYYPSLEGKRVGTEMLFPSFEKLLFNKEPTTIIEAEEITAQVETLADEFQRFCKIRQGRWPYEDESANVSEWERLRLRRLVILLRHELAIPLLMAGRARLDQKDYAELTHLIEKFAFRYKNVCGGHTTPAQNHYYKAAKALRDNVQSTRAILNSLKFALRKLLEDRASEDKFRADLLEQAWYGTSAQKANLKELLTTIDDYWSWLRKGGVGRPKHEQMMVIDLDKVTIEHIYPQKPGIGDQDTRLEAHVNELGNLAYWGPEDNVYAGNLPFEAKRELYKHSKSPLGKDLAGLPSWDISQLKSRQKRLLDDACKVFWI